MTTGRQPHDELRELLCSMEEGSVSPGGLDRIDELVRGDEKLLRYYVEYMRLVSDLRFGPGNDRVHDVMARLFDVEQPGRSTIDNPPHYSRFVARSPLAAVHAPIAIGRLSLLLYDGGAVAGAWVVDRFGVQSFVSTTESAAGVASSSRPDRTAIGGPRRRHRRIADGPIRATKTVEGDRVPLGRKYALSSGFMEITYDTGARVILQGPCTYEVESARGGFLSLGKLTARVEKEGSGFRPKSSGFRVEGRANRQPSPLSKRTAPTTSLAPRPSADKWEKGEGRREKRDSNPQSLIPNPLFAVRTPTAVVTDLGTEFGVEVDRSGTTRSHVFRARSNCGSAQLGKG